MKSILDQFVLIFFSEFLAHDRLDALRDENNKKSNDTEVNNILKEEYESKYSI